LTFLGRRVADMWKYAFWVALGFVFVFFQQKVNTDARGESSDCRDYFLFGGHLKKKAQFFN
jgi:hypothetical protein